MMNCVCSNMSKPVVGHCDVCEEYLCSDCKAAHEKLKVTRTHKIKSMAHMITTLKQDLHKVRDKIHKEIMAIDQMSTDIENMSLDKKKKMAEVNQFLDSLIEAIESHREKLVRKIIEADGCLAEKLPAKQEKLKQHRLVLQSWQEYVENVMKSDDVAILSDVISLHGTTLAGNSGKIAEITSEVEKMNNVTKSGIRLVKNDDMIDLKSFINVEIDAGFNVANAEAMATDEKPSGFLDLVNCKYERVQPKYRHTDNDVLMGPISMSFISDQFCFGFVNEIGIYDKDGKNIKKLSYKELGEVRGISYTHTGDIIASCSSGLHQLDTSGNYVRKLKRGNFGRSFTIGEEVYVVDACNLKVIALNHVNGVWKSVSEIYLPFDDVNDILVKESGIYIGSGKNCCLYHYSLNGDLLNLQRVDVPQSEDGYTLHSIHPLGVDAYGNMLIALDSGTTVNVFTNEKQWFDVPFLTELLVEEFIQWVVCEGDEVFAVFYYDDSTFLRFKKV